jgi:hypothetical protein
MSFEFQMKLKNNNKELMDFVKDLKDWKGKESQIDSRKPDLQYPI